MATELLNKEQREAKEDAELAAAEAAFEAEHGTATPNTTDEVVDDGTRGTPSEAPEQSKAEEVDWEKRYKDLQSYHDKEKAELLGKLKEAGVEPDETDRVAELEAQLAELQAKENVRETESAVADAQKAVSSAHPDFVAVISSPDFAEWIKGQPDVYQHAIYDDRPNASLAIDALTLFKVQTGNAQASQRAKQMQDQAALSVSGGHREIPQTKQEKVWTWAEINHMSPSEYSAHEKEIDAAFSKGLIR